ncbi:MAG: DUF3734 domain-containing protein [Rhodanobacter sp.]
MSQPAPKKKPSRAASPRPARRAQPAAIAYQTKALVLQGGGALGSYQAGVYEVLAEAGHHPNWVAGISIGALNAAIIAGNAPERRVEKLREFWETICKPPLLPVFDLPALPSGEQWPLPMLGAMSGWAAWRALSEGQAGFFSLRMPPPYIVPPTSPGNASYYDTSSLRATLERLADFDRINDAREMRVSVGAVNVANGNFAYFDNTEQKLRAEHFMASGALPPGFPAVEIDGEYYWDGGMVSNTPLYRVLTEHNHRNALVFQVDLWSAEGPLPHDMMQVAERAKDIQYSSRTRLVTDYMRSRQQKQRLLHDLLELVPASRRSDSAYVKAQELASSALVNVVHLIYRNKPYESHFKDYEFSAATMLEHWRSGVEDMRHTLAHPQWLAAPDPEHPFVTHDVHRA